VDPVRVGAASFMSCTVTSSQPSITTRYSSLSTKVRPLITTSLEFSTFSDWRRTKSIKRNTLYLWCHACLHFSMHLQE